MELEAPNFFEGSDVHRKISCPPINQYVLFQEKR